MFESRLEAGEKLAKAVLQLKGSKGIVLGIPRGGVVVAKVVAEQLSWPLEVIVTKKIGFPGHDELAIGAVAEDGEPVWDEEMMRRFGFLKEDLKEQLKRAKKKVGQYVDEFRQGKRLQVKDKMVMVVDDGIATGRTVEAGIKWLREEGVSRLLVAVPVCARDTAKKLKKQVDEFVCLHQPWSFMAVGQFYREFPQVSDEEVKKLLLGHNVLYT
jgi:predicted phosphoribosyltransferase